MFPNGKTGQIATKMLMKCCEGHGFRKTRVNMRLQHF